MTEAIDYVKTELMPDFDFDAFNHENNENYEGGPYEVKKDNYVEKQFNAEENTASANTNPENSCRKQMRMRRRGLRVQLHQKLVMMR